MLTMAAPSGAGGIPAAVTDGGAQPTCAAQRAAVLHSDVVAVAAVDITPEWVDLYGAKLTDDVASAGVSEIQASDRTRADLGPNAWRETG
jgi:hypothetical protein